MLWLSIFLTVIFTILIISVILFLWKKKQKEISKTDEKKKPKKVHKGLRSIAVGLILCGIIVGTLNISTRLAYIKIESSINGFAEWRSSNTQKYLYVEAKDRYSLGYLEGQFLAVKYVNFKNVLIALNTFTGISYSELITEAKKYQSFVPEMYLQEMQGMADGASQGSGWPITFEDILVQNTFLDINYGHFIPQGRLNGTIFGCTDIGAKNANGSVMIGQNFDFPKVLDKKSLFPALSFVHTKLEGYPEIFGLRMGAMLSLPTAKTTNGITVVVTVIGTNIESNYSTPAICVVRNCLEKAKTLEEAKDMVFTQSYLTVGCSLLACNSTDMIGVQYTPLGYRLRTNNTIVNTNRYIYDDWNEKYYIWEDYSLSRQKMSERLLRERYDPDSTLTYEELIEILGTDKDGPEGEDSAPCYDYGISSDKTLAVLTVKTFAIGTVHDGLGIIPF